MNKKKLLLGLGVLLIGFILGIAAVDIQKSNQTSFIPTLSIIGDVPNSITFHSLKDIGKLEEIKFQGTKYKVTKLANILNKLKPLDKTFQLYLEGSDGFTSIIKSEQIEDCFISFTSKNGWEVICTKHPVNANAKSIQNIVVVSEGNSDKYDFNIINCNRRLVKTTPGKLYAGTITEYPYFEGEASLKDGGKTYESKVYTRRKVFKLGDLTGVNVSGKILLLGEKGEWSQVDNQGYFQLKGSNIDYIQPDTREVINRVKGVVVDPPSATIMDTYYDTMHYLEDGKKVLVIILDGFNYKQYEYAIKNGYAPFLAKNNKAVQSIGVYPIKSNVWFASMITGQAPCDNGIISSNNKELKLPSIFTEASKLKKKALFIDSGKELIKTGAKQILVADKNKSGSADDELDNVVLTTGIDNGYDLLCIKFHNINDVTNHYGQLSSQAMQSVTVVDNYIAEIEKKWPGKVIITGSQGEQTDLGRDLSCDRMIIPYVILNNNS
ncbi:hypothetical protein CLRAG_34120 [Clostridium ragsdalei P11]|uniref:Type I phosphodiesterase / nucleotide pyrophosphatase n=1 Tax=Clostridium ragsdalei P11 TaxID=1353534 RepID=A0A1A6AL09_9CLOT|nr:hypothetical protein [Clostridium ragsdalei]OBR90764.1 hypothetical protein CLRAG_34120 [Clostridium ragsdalei P11]